MKNFFSIILAILVITGCDRTQSDSSREPEVKAGQKVSLQLQWVTQCQFAGFYVALDKGWYKDEGIDLTIYPGGPDMVPVDMVISGSRDFGTTLLADLARSIQQGAKAIGIAQIQQDNGLRLLAKTSSGIQGPADFKGKRVGVWLGGWEVQFNALMAQHHLGPGQVDVISQGFSMAPFLEGRLDVASAMIYNEYHMVLDQGMDRAGIVVMDYGDYGLGFPGDVLFTSCEQIRENPELCQKMVRASLKGWAYALDHQDEAVAAVVNYDPSGVAAQAHQEKMMKEVAALVKAGDAPLGRISPETIARMIDILVKYQVMGQPIPARTVYTDRFVPDPSK